jgi:uncharacterized membrane protein YedE/YeeE
VSEADQVMIAFAVLGVVAGVASAILAAWVQHLNNVIRDLRFHLQEAEWECDMLESAIKRCEKRRLTSEP